MRFGTAQKRRFNADEGAYSIVTAREDHDSQITLTENDYEAELVLSHFGDDRILRGNVKSGSGRAALPFRLHGSGIVVHLNVVFPKSHGNELRLYLAESRGFRPHAGEVCFLYVRESEIWIGSQPETVWRGETAEQSEDVSDAVYQEVVHETDPVRINKLSARDSFGRNRAKALRRFSLAGYQCEYDPSHPLFVSRFTTTAYLEAHHLIPLSFQRDLQMSLDTVHNVYALCPNCHRAIHHSEVSLARLILDKLTRRVDFASRYHALNLDLHELYGLETID